MNIKRIETAMRMKQNAMSQDVCDIVLTNQSGRYDTLSGEFVTDTTETITVKALLGRYHENEVNGVLIQENDIRFEIMTRDLGLFDLNPNTVVLFEDILYNVVRFRKVMLDVNTHIQLRAT